MSTTKIGICAFAILFGWAATNCHAHFLWVASDDSTAIAFFGEDSNDRQYHLPENLANLKAHHRTLKSRTDVELVSRDDEQFVGLVSKKDITDIGVIETSAQYGIYHGTLLTYYAKHYLSADESEWKRLGPSKSQRLDIVPDFKGNDVVVQVFWNAKPAKGVDVSVIGHDPDNGKQATDKDGRVTFRRVPNGLLGILASLTEKDRNGEVDGEKYTSATHIATLTIQRRGYDIPDVDTKSIRKKQRPDSEQEAVIRALPQAVASFGAAVSGDYLYVYGGHIGEAHSHSRDNLANQFLRLSLDAESKWEDLPFETPVQGLALVAHDGMIYRIGGMTAKNSSNEADELHSTTDVSRFSPETRKWDSLTPLPDSRSSHDAVVIGDKVYVVGGWKLTGSDEGQWHSHSLVADFSTTHLNWKDLPEQPFQRRALAVGQLNDNLIVIGGIDSNGDVSRDVDVFSPELSSWTKGKEFPGQGMNGFGASAWNLGGRLYASGSDGVVYCLTSRSAEWTVAGTLGQPRFFHRLVAGQNGTLLALGGTSQIGHLDGIELFDPNNQH